MSRGVLLGWAVLALVPALLATPISLADEPKAADSKPTAEVSPEIKHWVDKLSDPDSNVRDEAVQKLVAIGKSAIEPVADAASGSTNLELISRCISVLSDLRKSKDDATKEAATATLKKLAESPNKSVARRAQAIVGGKPRAQEVPPGQQGIVINQQNGARISVRTVNGDTELTASEGGREAKISKKASGEIEMEVTEPGEAGKPGKSTKYAAKDVDELKQKHPEAAQLYEKYMARGRMPNLNIRFGRAFPILPAVPGAVARVAVDIADLKKAAAEMSQAQTEVKSAADKLKAAAKAGTIKPEELTKLAEDLDAAVKRLDEARQNLETLAP